jgi:flagellar basal-body rod modification protein FlgD
MQGIQPMAVSTPQMAESAQTVASTFVKPHAAAATGTSSTKSPTASGAATITANDFLTLLVAEMKNQDPTQPTDPNAYISQMVNVNSLQQLIAINQGVSTLDTTAGSTGTASNAGSGPKAVE